MHGPSGELLQAKREETSETSCKEGPRSKAPSAVGQIRYSVTSPAPTEGGQLEFTLKSRLTVRVRVQGNEVGHVPVTLAWSVRTMPFYYSTCLLKSCQVLKVLYVDACLILSVLHQIQVCVRKICDLNC